MQKKKKSIRGGKDDLDKNTTFRMMFSVELFSANMESCTHSFRLKHWI